MQLSVRVKQKPLLPVVIEVYEQRSAKRTEKTAWDARGPSVVTQFHDNHNFGGNDSPNESFDSNERSHYHSRGVDRGKIEMHDATHAGLDFFFLFFLSDKTLQITAGTR